MRHLTLLLTAMLISALVAICSAQTGPAQWRELPSPTPDQSLRGLQSFGNRTIFASGTGGTVIITNDSGKHWNVLHVPGAEKLDLRGIQFCGTDCLIVMSSGPAEQGAARIFRTTDLGKTWRLVWTTDRKGVFLDAILLVHDDGYVLGDPVDGRFFLLESHDAGKSWTQLKPEVMPAALPGEGAFAASNSSLSLCGNGICFATGGASKSRVFRASDPRKTWTTIETPIPAGKPSAGIFSLHINAETGIAAGGDYQDQSHSAPNVAITHDGGRSWSAVPNNFEYRSGAVYLKGEMLTVGPTGSEISYDDGKTWTSLRQSGLNAVSTIDGCHFAAAGAKGKIVVLNQAYCF